MPKKPRSLHRKPAFQNIFIIESRILYSEQTVKPPGEVILKYNSLEMLFKQSLTGTI